MMNRFSAMLGAIMAGMVNRRALKERARAPSVDAQPPAKAGRGRKEHGKTRPAGTKLARLFGRKLARARPSWYRATELPYKGSGRHWRRRRAA